MNYVLPTESISFNFRAVALYNGTFINTTDGTYNYIMALDRGKYIELRYSDRIYAVSSNKAILVIAYGITGYNKGDYFVTAVPAISQYCNQYLFNVDGNVDYLTIITPTEYQNQFVFFEAYVPSWERVYYVDMNGTQYFVANMKVERSEAFRKLSLLNTNATFGGFLIQNSFPHHYMNPLGICM